MNRVSNQGRRYDGEPKLNVKKVAATVIAVLAVIIVIASIKSALTKTVKPKAISVPAKYFTVYTNDKWGVIDNTGKTIIKPEYDEMIVIPDPNKDIFVCTYGVDYNSGTYKTKVLNSKAQQIFTNYDKVEAIENNTSNKIWYEDSVLKFEKDGKYGLINFEGKVVLGADYKDIYSLEGIEKSIVIEKDEKKGLASGLGEIIILPEYQDIVSLTNKYSDGYIVTADDGKVGLISTDRKMIFDTKYDYIEHVTGNGMYAVKEEGKYKIVNQKGEEVLTTGIEKVTSIKGTNFVVQEGEKFGVVGLDGTKAIECDYEDLKYCFDDCFIAKKDGKYGIVDINGNIKVDFDYNTMNYVEEANFIQADNLNNRTEILDSNFNAVLVDVIISEINQEKGYICVRVDGTYKYYNFKFEEKKSQDVLATKTLFLVKENGKYGYVNNKGEKIVDCKYDDAKEQNDCGYCAVKRNGKWGVLDTDGSVLLEPSVDLEENLYVDFVGTWHLDKDLSLNVYTK